MPYQTIYLTEIYNNEIALPDVTAAEALAGDVSTFSVTIKNDGKVVLSQIGAWMDGTTALWVQISQDNVAFSAPQSRAAALVFPDVKPGDTFTLYIKRTIPANTTYYPRIRTKIYFKWMGR